MKFGFTFINYNNSRFTKALLASLTTVRTPARFHVVIVDNASKPEDRSALELICAAHDNVTLLLNDRNLGYFPGLNCGIEKLRSVDPTLDHIVVGNNDLEFYPDFIESVERSAPLFERHAVVAPNLIGPDGEHQNPHVIEPIGWKRELVYDLYYSNYQLARFILKVNRLLSRYTSRKDHLSHDVPREIHQGYGACYILGPLFLERLGLLWAPTFLMGEEYFLAKQLADKGLSQFYEPTIRVFHSGHATTSNVPRREMWEIAKASHKVYRQHKPRF